MGRLDLHPFRLAYRYAGALPLGLGELNAEGVYPGAWLSGTYRYGEAVLALEGLPGFRVGLSGRGEGEVGPEGVALVLEGFRYGPLALFGRVEGAWGEVSGSGRVAVFGREARVSGRFGAEGSASPSLGTSRGRWPGRGLGRGGSPSGRGGWPSRGRGSRSLRGRSWGRRCASSGPGFRWGVWLDLGAREAGGRARLLSRLVPEGVEAWGEGGASASPTAFRASASPWRGRWT